MQTVLMTLMFAGSIALAALWGGGRDGAAMAVPLLPLLVIHAAGLRAPRSVPSWLVFAGGLLVDLGTHGPLGYWALIYLVGLMIAHLVPEAMAQRPGVRAALGGGHRRAGCAAVYRHGALPTGHSGYRRDRAGCCHHR